MQEFQVLTNSFAPEYGRSAGGVVNIVTRAGSNDFHGAAFGYLRDRSLQAVNPFSTVSDPAYTRVQTGIAFGGPIRKDRMYYFLSYETTRREETEFSTIGSDGFGLVNIDASRFFGAGVTIQGTPDQQAFLEKLADSGECGDHAVRAVSWWGIGDGFVRNSGCLNLRQFRCNPPPQLCSDRGVRSAAVSVGTEAGLVGHSARSWMLCRHVV